LFIRNEFKSSEPLIEEESKGSGTYTSIDLHAMIPGNLYFQNSQLNCELEGEMWILKSGSEPYRYSGTLNVQKGKFYYYGWEFEVVQGSIEFDPLEFNPTLDIEARVDLAAYAQSDTMTTRTEEDYVTVLLSGYLDNPTLVFNSDKYTESDILMYLSYAKSGTEETLNQSQISTGAKNVFGTYFERQLEKNISQISGLDEFELRTRGNYQQADQWSVTLGRKIAPNLYFTYERSLSLIEPNQQFGVEYRLNRSVSLTGDIENGLWRINYLYKYRY
jgi:autotransporter translocation and assembly factor TamB